MKYQGINSPLGVKSGEMPGIERYNAHNQLTEAPR